MPSTIGLQCKNLSLRIGQQQILSDINLDIGRGQVLGVLGPNGAGKTSLLKLLSGQIASQDWVSWNNIKLADYDAMALAQQIAVVNQLNDSVFALDLEQIVRMGLLPHKSLLSRHNNADQLQVEHALERVGLTNKLNQRFSALSGGEQQRGLIARALVQQAKLIVLDEPVNHLDVYYQHQVLKLLQTLAHQSQISIIMSLHDLNLAANYCDQLCLLDQGQVVSQGTAQNVLQASVLSEVYRTPCEVKESPKGSGLRVEFYPPDDAPKNSQGSEHG